MSKVNAFVYTKEGFDLEKKEVDQVPLGATFVEVEITCTSLCHTDLSLGINDWGVSQYPMVAGHEGVGIVREVGSAVKVLKVGDRVAVGWMRDSCGACRRCEEGDESLCFPRGAAGTSLIFSGPGTFAERVRVAERFAFAVPESLKSTAIAPLMCAGITVYRPLRVYCNWPGARVLVVGVGGLGHLAIKFAAKMGFEVVAASRGTSKKEKSLKLGAHKYVDTTNADELASIKAYCDLVLYTASGGLIETFVPVLRNGGTIVQLGVPANKEVTTAAVPIIPVVFSSLQYTGSAVGGSIHTNEMLEFAALHNIVAECEVKPIDELPAAVKQMHDDPKSIPFRFAFTTPAWDKEKDF